MPAGNYQVWAIANGSRKDTYSKVVPGCDRSGVDFYCGTPVIDSDGPTVVRCNITASSASSLTVSHFAYDLETRLRQVTFGVRPAGSATLVVPATIIYFEGATEVFAFKETNGTPINLANGNYELVAKYVNGEGYETQRIVPFTLGSATAPVSGTLTLQNYSTTLNRDLTLQLRTPGTTTVIESYSLSVHNGSTFTINTTRRGSYDIAIRGAHFMRGVIPNVNITNSGVSGLALTLKNGDVNGDNSVGATDFTLLRAAYGSSTGGSGWNPMADLNGDGSVGTTDFNILRANYGLSGSL